MEHIVELVGADVGPGSHFDGVRAMPREIVDVTSLGRFTEELLRRGWSESDLQTFYGGDLLRVWRQVEKAADKK